MRMQYVHIKQRWLVCEIDLRADQSLFLQEYNTHTFTQHPIAHTPKVDLPGIVLVTLLNSWLLTDA